MIPLVSVIMGIYNCEKTLSDALDCIFSQTYKNWELILCDDGSQDNTYGIAKTYKNKAPGKIHIIRNKKNQGLNVSLNRCLAKAKGEYVARMDGDDLCDPSRFEKQIRFLMQHDEFGLVSSRMYLFDENGIWGETHQIERPGPKDIVEGSPICHAPVMIRRDCLTKVNGYSEKKYTYRVEDVDLWIRLYAAGYRCYNIPEPLYSMRNDKNAVQRRKYQYRINSTRVRLRGCRQLNLGLHSYIFAFNPMLIGLVPGKIRMYIKQRLKKRGI